MNARPADQARAGDIIATSTKSGRPSRAYVRHACQRGDGKTVLALEPIETARPVVFEDTEVVEVLAEGRLSA